MTSEQETAIYIAVKDLKERLYGQGGDKGDIPEIREVTDMLRKHWEYQNAQVVVLEEQNRERDKRCDAEASAIATLKGIVENLRHAKIKATGIIIGAILASGASGALVTKLLDFIGG